MPTPVRPTNLQVPFASSGLKDAIPVAPGVGPQASYTEGFPPVTMQAVASGGQPPKGRDFNGLFFDITTHTLWVGAGGQYLFDSALSTAMGGYPKGMVLQDNANTSSYVSAINNNTTDFNTTPAAIGVSWLPYSGQASSSISVATVGGTTALNAIQAAARMITVSGVLASNAILTVPAVLAELIIINATTGSFSLTVTTVAGTGVTVVQGGADRLFCNAVNVYRQHSTGTTAAAGDASEALATDLFVQRAVSSVGGYYQDVGAVGNAYIVATNPVTVTPVVGQALRFRTTRGNTGAVTLNAGGGAVSIKQEDGGALEAGDIPSGSINTVTFDGTVWVYNGQTASDFLNSPALRGTPTAPTPAAGASNTIIPNTAWVQAELAGQSASAAMYQLGLLF